MATTLESFRKRIELTGIASRKNSQDKANQWRALNYFHPLYQCNDNRIPRYGIMFGEVFDVGFLNRVASQVMAAAPKFAYHGAEPK